MAHDFTVDPSGNIIISSGYTLVQLAGGVHYEATSTNVSGAVSTLDFGGKAVLLYTVTGNLSGSYTFPPLNMPSLTQNSTRTVLMIEYTQDATGGRAIPLNTLFANATRIVGLAGADCVDTAIGGKTRVRLVVKRVGGVTTVDAEFIPIHRHSNITVGTQHSLTGGSNLGANVTLSLVGDTATPGNNKFYGTDGSGVRGWQNPIGLDNLSDVTITAPSTNQVLTYNGSVFVNAEPPAGGGGVASEVVDTIAALQAIASPTAGQIVNVRGYHIAHDGGHGVFMWDHDEPDNQMLTNATVAAGGTGYAIGHLIWVSGGTVSGSNQACVRVATVSGSAVATVTIVFYGDYAATPGTSGIATTSQYGTGCTLNLTWGSNSNFGTFLPKGAGGVGRWKRLGESSGLINVRAFGAKGDGVTDDWLAIQRAIWTTAPIYIPAGTFVVTKSLTWIRGRSVTIIGNGKEGWGSTSLSLTGNISEPLLHPFGAYINPDGSYTVESGYEASEASIGGIGDKLILKNIRVISTVNLYGSCVSLHLMKNSLFENVTFYCKFRGLTLGQSVFDTSIIHCDFRSIFMGYFPWTGTTNGESNKEIAKRAWGASVTGHAFMHGSIFVGNGTGLRITGNGNTVIGARIEVNNYGIIASSSAYQTAEVITTSLIRSFISGMSIEANTTGIRIENMGYSMMTAFGIQGSPTDGTRPDSEIGMELLSMDSISTISNFTASGLFTKGAIRNSSAQSPQGFTASGNVVSYARMTGVFGATSGQPTYRLVGYRTGAQTLTAFSDLYLKGLTGLNLRDSIEARNFGDVATPATGATTVAVVFPIQYNANSFAFNTLTASGSGTTLAAGTYYYATTVISKTGETGINYGNANQHAHRTITITSGQQVVLTFLGGTVANLKRRIYRTKVNDEIGNFEGYWEQSNTASSFTDTNQAFLGRSHPPSNVGIMACDEVNTNYQIALSPSWGTTAWVTNKTTTGFTINFGTAAPAGGTCGWLLYRP